MSLPRKSKSEIEDRVNLWNRLRNEFAHAFALPPTRGDFTQEEIMLLEKVANVIVTREMAVPALLFLESLAPLNFLGSQVIHGLAPFLEMMCDPAELERLAVILEQRDSINRLVALIEEQSSTLA